MIDNNTVSVLSTQITLSGLSVLLLQKLKTSSWAPWFHRASDKLNMAFSAILAFASAIGIHLTWATAGAPGAFTLGITGLTLTGIGYGLWSVIKSLVLNEIIYRGTAKTQTPGQPAQVLEAGAPPPGMARKP